MIKHRAVYWFATVAALICPAAAQNPQGRSSSAKSSSDPLKTATQPLTPKSAMPAHPKSSVAAPRAAAGSQKSNAELNRLERQNIKAVGSKNETSKASSSKAANTPSGNGSGINASYQKPRVPKKN